MKAQLILVVHNEYIITIIYSALRREKHLNHHALPYVQKQLRYTQ